MTGPLEEALAGAGFASSSVATVSARATWGTLSQGGDWAMDCENLAQVYAAEYLPDFPDGSLVFAPAGKFALELPDYPGWAQYLAIRGIEEGRPVRVTGWYSVGDAEPEVRVDTANWDAAAQCHTNLGPTSDGTFQQAQSPSRIIVEVTDGGNWTVLEAKAGWVVP